MSCKLFSIFCAVLLVSKSETEMIWKSYTTMNITYTKECDFKTENNIINLINTIRSRCSEACFKNLACTHYTWIDENCSLRKDYVNKKGVISSKNYYECGILENRTGKKKIQNKYAAFHCYNLCYYYCFYSFTVEGIAALIGIGLLIIFGSMF